MLWHIKDIAEHRTSPQFTKVLKREIRVFLKLCMQYQFGIMHTSVKDSPSPFLFLARNILENISAFVFAESMMVLPKLKKKHFFQKQATKIK